MTRAFWFAVWLVVRAYAFTRPSVVIFLDGAPYIRRWFLTCTPAADETGPPGWYLHAWYAPDSDRYLHDHPWYWATTRLLKGDYLERKTVRFQWPHPMTRDYWRRAGDRSTLLIGDRHRIASVSPGTSTLFHAGPKHGLGWGPKGENGWVEHHEPEWREALASLWGRL